MNRLEAIAFYLPQFHPTALNDASWGAGFTEWVNVANARPLYPGHEQPFLPGALGFYDLRLAETRSDQAALARTHGVTGFCYWHYWFGRGQRVLDRVFDEVLASGSPDFPFCLGWANHSWTGIWAGERNRLLMEQTYDDPEDERAHFAYLATAFRDPRYVRIDGRPLFYIWNPRGIPDAQGFTARLRDHCRGVGIGEIYLIGEAWNTHMVPSHFGLDAAACVAPRPLWVRARRSGRWARLRTVVDGLTRRMFSLMRRPDVRSYSSLSPHIPWSLREFGIDETSFPCVVPGWDDTPRNGRRGRVVHGSTPEIFATQVRTALDMVRHSTSDPQIVFLKSWNEWAEGNVMEPSRRWGTRYLEAFATELAATVGAEGLEPPTSSL